MLISKQTVDTLKAQGINVRWFPEETYEEFRKAQWEQEYKRCFDDGKKYCKELNPSNEDSWWYKTLAEFEDRIKKYCDRGIDRWCDPYEFTTLYVEHDNGQMLVKKENVKSKEITVEYILKLVEKDRKVYAGTYGKFAMAMQRICRERGLANKFWVYPTTYGIGVWLFFNSQAGEHIAKVEEIMKERNIEYYNEYSVMHWVYRFKVSKKRENIERMCV